MNSALNAVRRCAGRFFFSTAPPPATTAPAYTITDLPLAKTKTAPSIKRGWFVLRGIKGHTKKLSPLARQVC